MLSEFAGAAQELGEALRINPYDEEGTAETIARALEMDEESRAERMAALHERVERNDAVAWGDALPRWPARRHQDQRACRMRADRPAPDPIGAARRLRGRAVAPAPARLRRHARAHRPAAADAVPEP